MRHRAQLSGTALACSLALAGCGGHPSPEVLSGDGAAAADDSTTASPDPEGPAPASAEIPDDFPLSAGMGGPQDTVPTARTGTGLRSLVLCDTAPLRGFGTRDRMVADNSGGESANTRELVLLGSPEEATRVAQSFTDLPSGCDGPTVTGDMETLTEVRRSPFGPAPAATLVQTYTFDGEPGTGATVIHVVPAGAALLVTSTYGQWPGARLEEGIAGTVVAARETVAALAQFDDSTPSSEASPEPTGSPTAVPKRLPRVGSARMMVTTYGEGSLASLDEQADGVTGTTEKIVPAVCVFTKTGC